MKQMRKKIQREKQQHKQNFQKEWKKGWRNATLFWGRGEGGSLLSDSKLHGLFDRLLIFEIHLYRDTIGSFLGSGFGHFGTGSPFAFMGRGAVAEVS